MEEGCGGRKNEERLNGKCGEQVRGDRRGVRFDSGSRCNFAYKWVERELDVYRSICSLPFYLCVTCTPRTIEYRLHWTVPDH